MTSRGQTSEPISAIFNRLLEGTIDGVYPKYEVSASKTVASILFTDRQTHTHTHTDRHTDGTENMIVAHQGWATIISYSMNSMLTVRTTH